MTENYRDATPDDLPEETGGFNAALNTSRSASGNDAIANARAARQRSTGGSGTNKILAAAPSEILARARAARARADEVLGRVRASQSGTAPRRAVGTELSRAHDDSRRALAAARAENDLHQRDIRRGRPDPLRAEHIARADRAFDDARARARRLHRENTQASVFDLQRTVDMQARQIRALRTGQFGGAESGIVDARGRKITAAARDYTRNFEAYLRHDDDGARRSMRAALTTREDTGGGYFLPEEWDRTMSGLLLDVSVMRQLATVRTISGPLLKMPKKLDGATARWVGETTAPTETDLSTVAELEFSVMTMEAFPLISQELLEDANTDLEGWMAADVQDAFGRLENPAFITGTGSKQPRGLLSYSFTANATYEAAPATYWGTFGYLATGVSADWPAQDSAGTDAPRAAKLIDMVYSLRPAARANASWLVNRTLVTDIRKWKDANGNFIWQQGLVAGQPDRILNYPVNEDDYMPAKAANSYSLGFGDWASTYLILDRLGSTVLRDPYTQKPYICFYTRKRVGGGVKEFQRAKFLKFGTS